MTLAEEYEEAFLNLETSEAEARADAEALSEELMAAELEIGDLRQRLDASENKLDCYQEFTRETAIYPADTLQDAVIYLALGLASEAGEVAGKIKKVLRDEKGVFSNERQREIAEELGDVVWYTVRLADELGYTASWLIERNQAKLESRAERGVLGGSGDNR